MKRLTTNGSIFFTALAIGAAPLLSVGVLGCSKSGRSRSGVVATASSSGTAAGANASTSSGSAATTGGPLVAAPASGGTAAPGAPAASPSGQPTAAATGTSGGTAAPSAPTSTPTAPPAPTSSPAPSAPTSSPAPTSSSPAPGATTSPVPAPPAPPPTPPAGPAPAPAADDTAPVLVITSPERAAFSSSAQLVIAGNAVDAGSGVATVTINGTSVNVDSNGDFSVQATVGEGLNIITIQAIDRAGNIVQNSRSVLAGNFIPTNGFVPEAIVARIEESAFDKMEPVMEGFVNGRKSLISDVITARNPILDRQVLFIEARADVTGVDFSTVDVDLDPVNGGLDFTATLNDLDIDLRAQLRAIVRISVSGEVTMDRLTVSGRAVMGVDPQTNQLAFDLQNSDVTIEGFNLDMNNIPDFIDNLLRGLVQGMVEDQLRAMLQNDIGAQVTAALGAMNQPIQRNILGRDFVFGFAPTGLAFDDAGLSMSLAANVDAAAPTAASANAPGSLATVGAAPSVGSAAPADFAAAINDDLINRAFFAAWRSGLLDLEIDPGAALSNVINNLGGAVGINLPNFSVDSSILLMIFPQLQGIVPPGAPLIVRAEPRLPPVLRMVQSSGATPVATAPTPTAPQPNPGPANTLALQLDVGELVVSIEVADPATGQRITIVSIALQAVVGAGLTMDPQGQLFASLAGQPQFAADILVELIDLPDRGVQVLVGQMLPAVISMVANGFGGIPLPTPAALPVDNLQVGPVGPSGDFLGVAGQIRTP